MPRHTHHTTLCTSALPLVVLNHSTFQLIDCLRSQLLVNYWSLIAAFLHSFTQSHAHLKLCVGVIIYFLHTTHWIIDHNASCFLTVEVVSCLIVDLTMDTCRKGDQSWIYRHGYTFRRSMSILEVILHYDTQPVGFYSHSYSMFLLAVLLKTILSSSAFHLRCTHVRNWVGRKKSWYKKNHAAKWRCWMNSGLLGDTPWNVNRTQSAPTGE